MRKLARPTPTPAQPSVEAAPPAVNYDALMYLGLNSQWEPAFGVPQPKRRKPAARRRSRRPTRAKG